MAVKTVTLYTQDARRFAIRLQSEHPGLKATEITSIDAKTYRDHLLAQRFTNPFRHLTMIEIVEPAPIALYWLCWKSHHTTENGHP